MKRLIVVFASISIIGFFSYQFKNTLAMMLFKQAITAQVTRDLVLDYADGFHVIFGLKLDRHHTLYFFYFFYFFRWYANVLVRNSRCIKP